MMRSLRFILATVFLAACTANAPQEPASTSTHGAAPDGYRKVPGTIDHYGDGPEIEIPAFVKAGVPFEMSVTTYS